MTIDDVLQYAQFKHGFEAVKAFKYSPLYTVPISDCFFYFRYFRPVKKPSSKFSKHEFFGLWNFTAVNFWRWSNSEGHFFGPYNS